MTLCSMGSEEGYITCLAASASSHLASLWSMYLFKVALEEG